MPAMALFSSSLLSITPKPHLPSSHRPAASPVVRRGFLLKTQIRAAENGAGLAGDGAVAVEEKVEIKKERIAAASVVVEDAKVEKKEERIAAASVVVEDSKVEKKEERIAAASVVVEETKVEALETVNGAAGVGEVPVFKDKRWIGGTWDLTQFMKDGKTDWDAVIDAEVKRRKWLEVYPESSTNEEPVLFDTSIIPWWAWMKRFHLPEAELLNGRAAMIGFFMAYLVDSLTGVGLVDQTGNFFCKTLLFIAVVGVLLIRKNEDLEKLKKLIEETTLYDKQWQATWQDDPTKGKSED